MVLDRLRNSENRTGLLLGALVLLIAIAVVGVFVLGIGMQQESVPETSFTSDENVVSGFAFKTQPCSQECFEATVVEITHDGGDRITERNLQMVVDGWQGPNATVFGNRGGLNQVAYDNERAVLTLIPPCSAKGGGESALESGESYYPMSYGGPLYQQFPDHSQLPAWENVPCEGAFVRAQNKEASSPYFEIKTWDGSSTSTMRGKHRDGNDLCAGDRIRLVWKAESGGKSEELFSRTVEQDSEWCQYK